MVCFSAPPAPSLRACPPWRACTDRPRPKALTRRAVLPLLSLPVALLAKPSRAKTPYDEYAPSYDNLDGSNWLTHFLGFDALRSQLLAHAKGSVVELGIGTGQNLAHYGEGVKSLVGVDTSLSMLKIARNRVGGVGFPVELLQASADGTGLPGGVFDTVVDTFSLCVYDRPAEALQEMRRLVKPGGQVLLLEHSAGQGLLRGYQDLTAGTVKRLSKGCVPNQRVREMVANAGFRVMEEISVLGRSVVSLRLVP